MVAVVAPTDEESYLLAILESPDGLDLAEFAWFDPEAEDGCYRAWDFQWSWYTCNDMNQIDQGGRALGKALALDTPIPTPTGWTTMGQLRSGDLVFDDAGQTCTVSQAHPVRQNRPCYEVVFSDGSVIVADAEHRWETWTRLERRSDQRFPTSQRGPSVRTTAEIAASLKDGRETNHSVDVAAALQLPPAQLPIEPYTFGVWASGNTVGRRILLSNDKTQIASEIRRRGVRVESRRPTKRGTVFVIGTAPLESLWHAAGGGRVIPPLYLRGSIAQRRDVLRGLFDTIGSLSRGVHAELDCSTPERAASVFELVASLGEQPILSASKTKVSWRPRVNPVLRDRPERWRPLAAQSTRYTQRFITDVRQVPSVPVRCITVDSPTSLYLAGEAMIPTHNTVGIKMRAFAFPFAYEGQSMLLTAPELNHLRPLTDQIEKALLTTRLMKEMLPDGKGKGIARQPHWQVRFRNGTSLISRLPNKDGKGVKGQHVINIEQDEAQDYPLAGWIEIVETLNAGLPGAMWRCHGVSKGVRDRFFEKTQPDSGWTVHRPMAMHRPTWGAKERESKIKEYGGSRQSIDYKRNIYGEHGDASNSVFVLARLMICCDIDEGSIYNSEVYTKVGMEFEHFPAGASDTERLALIHSWIDLPGTHLHGYSQKVNNKEVGSPRGYSAYWGGMDVGVTTHPSEILIFGQRHGTDFLELLTRVQMQRINTDDQMAVVATLMNFYGAKLRFGVDKTGVGFPIWDQLTRTAFGDRIYGFGFSEKRVVAFEDRPLVGSETIKDLAKYRNFVEGSTDWLRNDYVDAKRFRLPYDREILIEFQGQTYTVVRDTGDPYGTRRLFSGGSFHTLDAAKVAIGTKHIPPLEAMLDEVPVQESVLDVFVGM